jgi:hypothetical protein
MTKLQQVNTPRRDKPEEKTAPAPILFPEET